MTKCRVTNVNNTCAPEVTSPEYPTCSPFDVCLGGGRALTYDGTCFRVDGTVTITDGWYTEVKIEGGCITEARQAPLPIYTPPPCAPEPEPCSGGGNGSGVIIAPDTCNLSRWTAGGELLTTIALEAGAGVTISGCGSLNDPAIIELAASDSSVYIVSGTPTALTITGSGTSTDSFILRMVESPLGAGTYAGFTIDSYGRVIGYTEEEASGIIGIVAGPGIDVDVQSGLATIAMSSTGVTSGTYPFGGYDVQIDSTGRALNVTRTITLAAGTYRFGDYDVGVNETGSVTSITPVNAPPANAFSKILLGSRSLMTVQITTASPGKLRISYKGNLALTPPVGNGLQRYTGAGLDVRVNDDSQVVYCTSDTTVTALEVLTSATYSAGTHIIEIELANVISDPGMLDIVLVSEGV